MLLKPAPRQPVTTLYPETMLPKASILEIDLGAVAANYRQLCQKLGATECAGVVKADAYGLGMVPIAQTLLNEGCKTFFVAHIQEGLDLRRLAPEARIFVLNGLIGNEADVFHHHNLIPILNHAGQIEGWRKYLQQIGEAIPAAVHVDTGLNRLGVPETEWEQTLSLIDFPLAMFMSHLACAGDPQHVLNQRQAKKFAKLRQDWAGLIEGVPISFANSSGAFLGSDYHFDLARTGAAIYGINPVPYRKNPMHDAVRLSARVLQIKDVTPGSNVGYSGHYNAPNRRRIATIAAGHGDGIFRSSSIHEYGNSQSFIYFQGQPSPIVGSISMDLITVDITDLKARLNVGDYMEIINEHHTINDLAKDAGTIGYEVLTNLGERYERVYLEPQGEPEGESA